MERMVRAVGPVVALHGFAGTGRAWADVDPAIVAPDLPGHGAAADVRPSPSTRASPRCSTRCPSAARWPATRSAGASRCTSRSPRPSASSGSSSSRPPRGSTTRASAPRAPLRRRGAGLRVRDAADRRGRAPVERPAAVRRRPARRARAPGRRRAAQRAARTGRRAARRRRRSDDAGVGPPGGADDAAVVAAGERDARYVALAGRLAAGLGGPAELVVIPGAGHGLPREAPAAVRALLFP